MSLVETNGHGYYGLNIHNSNQPHRVLFRPLLAEDWAQIDRIVEEMMNEMKLVDDITSSQNHQYPVRVQHHSIPTPKPVKSLRPLDELMLAKDIYTIDTSNTVANILLDAVNATWEGTELIADKADGKGRHVVAKTERKSVKAPAQTLTPVNRISYKPKVYLSAKAAGSHAYKSYDDFSIPTTIGDANLEQKALTQICEMLALYSVCLPHFTEFSDSFVSYSEYVNNPGYFIADLEKFLKASDREVLDTAQTLGLPGRNISKQDVLEKVLRLDAHRNIVRSTLRDVNSVIEKARYQASSQPQTAQTTQSNSGATQMADSTRKTGKQKIKDSLQRGAITGVIAATNRKGVQMLIDGLGDKCPDFLKTEVGMAAIEGLIPLVILALSDTVLADRVPAQARDQIVKAAEYAFDGFTQNSAGRVTEEVYGVLIPLLQAYMEAGQKLELAEATPQFEDLLGQGTQTRVAERLEANKQL